MCMLHNSELLAGVTTRILPLLLSEELDEDALAALWSTSPVEKEKRASFVSQVKRLEEAKKELRSVVTN